jgi:hypothetical protein
VELRDPSGKTVLRYSDLFVVDATGRPFPSRLGVEAGSLSIRVDDAGAAYPVTVDPLIWGLRSKLLAADGAAGDNFGWSVAASGDTAVIGAFNDDDNGSGSGSAYVFVRSGVSWTQQQKLLPKDGAVGDAFGLSVAMSGDTAIIGAYHDDDNGSGAGWLR